MPARMRILGWRAEGLRCPDHEIDCRSSGDDPYPITLVQMPNGTGKTTTLALLRAALSGAAAKGSWDGPPLLEFQKKGVGRDSYGTFELKLKLNTQRVTVIMEFDFESQRVRYKTTRGHGQVDRFDPPLDFRRFMSDNFVTFYVFDGELAEHLLDRRQVHAEAVVENLFQINLLDVVRKKVAEYWDNKTSNTTATEERGLTRRLNRRDRLSERLATLKAEKRGLENERRKLAERLKSRQSAYEQEIKKEEARAQQLSAVQSKASELRGRVRGAASDVLDKMRDPHAMSACFAKEMLDLKLGLDRVKLPESAAREFFEELAGEQECVCGRPIDDPIRDVIRSRAQQYLGSEDVSLLNSMKTAIQEAVGQATDEPEQNLSMAIKGLESAMGDEREALNELDQLLLEAENSDPAVKDAKTEIDKLKSQLAELDHELEKFDSKDSEQGDDRTFGIDVIEKRLRDAEQKVAEITHTIELRDKRDVLTSILKVAHAKAREAIVSEVCAEANERIQQLMPYNDVVIDRIDRCLILRGKEGSSAGETLSVAYAFLATLFHRSEHQLPFVVDSPAGPIDLAVRPRIGELVPRLTSQFIAFTISSERDGFVPKLKQTGGGVQFVTLFRKGSEALESAARTAPGYVETRDGLMVPGEAFFDGFQLDAEDL